MLLLPLLAIVASAGLQAAPSVQHGSKSVADARVYVYTAPAAGGETEEERGRQDSVQDLRSALGGRRHVKLVDARDAADVVIEVLGREERDLGEGGYGGKSLTKFRETIVRIRISSQQRTSEIKGIGKGSWKSAAKDAAERVQKWIERG